MLTRSRLFTRVIVYVDSPRDPIVNTNDIICLDAMVEIDNVFPGVSSQCPVLRYTEQLLTRITHSSRGHPAPQSRDTYTVDAMVKGPQICTPQSVITQ